MSYNGLSAFLRCHGFYSNIVSCFSSVRHTSVSTYDENIVGAVHTTVTIRPSTETTGNLFLAAKTYPAESFLVMRCLRPVYVYSQLCCHGKTCVMLM